MIVKGIELISLPLTGIEFALNSKGITISCNYYNHDTKEDEPVKIYFHGVKNIFINEAEIGNTTEITIGEVELEESSEINKARFHFRAGSSKPGMELTFNYVTVQYSW